MIGDKKNFLNKGKDSLKSYTPREKINSVWNKRGELSKKRKKLTWFKIKYLKKDMLLLILLLCFALFFILSSHFSEYSNGSEYFNKIETPKCGDGTSYNECSSRQPYFCERGILVKNALICECPKTLTKEGDACFSKYQVGPKNIVLKYVLRGEEKEIKIIAYKGMADYLSELPKTIYYSEGEEPSRADFKLRDINEPNQKEFLLELLTRIQNIADSKEDQVRIAVSVVQNIPFGQSEKTTSFGPIREINYSRYPYEVIYDNEGVCGEKSELLAFLLREMGYGVVFFYNKLENHESIGIKCPKKFSLDDSGYCFIETTGPSIITDSEIEYEGVGKLSSKPELIPISDGDSLGDDLYEYKDAKELINLRSNGINMFSSGKLEKLKEKYGLVELYRSN